MLKKNATAFKAKNGSFCCKVVPFKVHEEGVFERMYINHKAGNYEVTAPEQVFVPKRANACQIGCTASPGGHSKETQDAFAAAPAIPEVAAKLQIAHEQKLHTTASCISAVGERRERPGAGIQMHPIQQVVCVCVCVCVVCVSVRVRVLCVCVVACCEVLATLPF